MPKHYLVVASGQAMFSGSRIVLTISILSATGKKIMKIKIEKSQVKNEKIIPAIKDWQKQANLLYKSVETENHIIFYNLNFREVLTILELTK
jgi:hypothetical protein